jgi:serine/threonine protein kinase
MNARPDLGDYHAQLSIYCDLPGCLDAHVNGQCGEDEFFDAVRGNFSENEFADALWSQLRADPQAARAVMAVANRLKAEGGISADLVRLLESKIAAGEFPNPRDVMTIDLKSESTGKSSHVAVDDHPPQSPIEVGHVLRDRYVIEKRLGSGGKGTVYKALDRYRSSLPVSQQYVAIKILHATASDRDEMVETLRRELYCAQMLSHRNVVNVFELDRDGDIDFFTMELLDGELLSSLIARFGPLPLSRSYAWEIIRQIASGLEHAHSRNVAHADLKPQNIMITKSGEVRILDFGASRVSVKQAADDRRGKSLPSLTPAYACCELLEGRAADPRDDLYALACISYELLTGTHPFQRRRATEARDFRIVPTKPQGLNRKQWQTLTKGFAWHRAGRSIPVGDWLKRLLPESENVGPLTSADLAFAHPSSQPVSSFRFRALLTLLAASVAAWILFARLGSSVKASAGTPSPVVASRQSADSAPANSGANSVGESHPANELNTRDVPLAASQSLASASQSPLSIGPVSGRTRIQSEMIHPITVSARDYEVRSGEHFAEIRVHRSSGLHTETPFVWWTEAASAKPGVDYVPQAKVTQSFPKSKSSTSFFVKLLPTASRARPEVFYIAIAEASGGASLGQVAHAAIWLPANRDPGSPGVVAANPTTVTNNVQPPGR